MKWNEIITTDPEIIGGVPVFKGTRVPIDTFISHLKAGVSLNAFLADFPSVTREMAKAFLAD